MQKKRWRANFDIVDSIMRVMRRSDQLDGATPAQALGAMALLEDFDKEYPREYRIAHKFYHAASRKGAK